MRHEEVDELEGKGDFFCFVFKLCKTLNDKWGKCFCLLFFILKEEKGKACIMFECDIDIAKSFKEAYKTLQNAFLLSFVICVRH